MPLAENRTVWPHADPVAAEAHLADHNAMAALLNGGVQAHAHVDADLPAGLARDTEVAAAYAPLVHTHAGGVTGGALRKTAPQTLTLTADTAVADMAFAVAANSTYVFQMELVVTTSTGTVPTTAWGFTGPAGATAVGITGRIDTSTSVQVDLALTALGNFAAQAQVANTGASFSGVIVTGGTAGTVQLTCRRAGTTPSMVIPAGVNGFWMKTA
jgi:hypothetical protein